MSLKKTNLPTWSPEAKIKRMGLHRKTERQELADIRVAKRGAKEETGIFEPKQLIRKALNNHERVAVSWSGGRCSTVVVYLTIQENPDVVVFHTNHGVHFPKTERYVKSLANEWDLNLEIVKPERAFWDVVEEHGFPGRRVGRGKPRCCFWLKERPLRRFSKDKNIEAFITGMRVSEARNRMYHTAQAGQYYYVERDGLNAWKYNPIAFWTTRQVNEFCEENEIPLNPNYEKGNDRLGCWPCTAFKSWYHQLSSTNPKMLRALLEKMGDKKLLDHFKRARLEPCKGRG